MEEPSPEVVDHTNSQSGSSSAEAKPKITMIIPSKCQLELSTSTGLWSCGNMLSGVVNHAPHLWEYDGKIWVRPMPGEHYLLESTVPNAKFDGGGVMIWSCFLGFGLFSSSHVSIIYTAYP